MRPLRTLSSLDHAVERHASSLMLRGTAAITFGLCATTWPQLTYAGLILLYAAYCLADGVVAFSGGVTASFWPAMATGTISLAAAAMALLFPWETGPALVYLIAAWSVARGIFEIALAMEFENTVDNERPLVAAGVVSIAFGATLALDSHRALTAIIWLAGGYTLLFGILLIALAMRTRQFVRMHRPAGARPFTRR